MIKNFEEFCNEGMFSSAIIRSKTGEDREEYKFLPEYKDTFEHCLDFYVSVMHENDEPIEKVADLKRFCDSIVDTEEYLADSDMPYNIETFIWYTKKNWESGANVKQQIIDIYNYYEKTK